MAKKSDKGEGNYWLRVVKRKEHLRIVWFFAFLILAFLLSYLVYEYAFNKNFGAVSFECADGTLYDSCLLVKPYFCDKGSIVENPVLCGCLDSFDMINRECVSRFQTNPKNVTLQYILNGETFRINYTVYGGMEVYLSKLSRSIYYSDGETFSRRDFKLRSLNQEEQRDLLLPLVIEIQNITHNKDDQVRIAISIVQNIPFNKSNRTFSVGEFELDYSRYPYEVLYENQGVCGEKSELLAFVLKEMGYDVAFLYYKEENHEALGIRCPFEYSVNNTGYCLIETTAPSVFSDDGITYVGGVKLVSVPEIIRISLGASITDDFREYDDAKFLKGVREDFESGKKINPIRYNKYRKLREYYGLVDGYNP